MGIFKSLVNKYERGANYELGSSLSSNSISTIFGKGGDDINVLEEYSGYVWKCINIRSEELSAIDFYVERKVADQWQHDENHEFNTVLEGAEGGLDEQELIEAHQIYMDMYGESFWYFSKGERSNKPFGVYLLDPAAMTVIVSGNRVTGYVYQKEAERLTFDLDEIEHYRITNPANPFRGAGPMQKAGWFIRSSRYAVTYVNNFLENNGIPAGVVVAKGTVDDKDWTLFKQQWKSNYGGIENSGKTGFVRGQDLEFIKTGLSLGDVDFEKVLHASREDILAMFSMPKSKLGMYEDFNRASSTTSDMMFSKTFTKPAVARIERKLSKKVANWYGKQFRLGSNFTIPEDRELKLNEYDKGIKRWVTINEAREAYGLPALTGKEFDTLQLENVTEAVQQPKMLGKVVIRTKNNKADFSYEMKESFRSQSEDLQVKYEQQFFKAVNPILKDQRDRMKAMIAPKKVVDANFDPQKEAQTLQAALAPIFVELAKAQGALAISFAGNDSMNFDLTPVAEKYIRDSIAKATLGFSEDTQKQLVQIIADGINNGDAIKTIANSIDDMYQDVLGVKEPGYRLERLARTEVIKTSNEITELAYKQTGVVQKKEWFANPGRCEFCASLNGSVISLGATFVPLNTSIQGTDGGTRTNTYEDVTHPPVHPACRCTLIPVIEGTI